MTLTRSGSWAASALLCLVAATHALPQQPCETRDEPIVVQFSQVGCFVDGENGRALAGASYDSDDMTIGSCAVFCTVKNFQFFGVEYGRECYCSNTNPARPAPSDDNCLMPCAGDASQTCGGGNRLKIYTNNLYAKPEPASLPDVPYLGCYVDNGDPRALPHNLLGADDMTAAKCAAHCLPEYRYFGLEYGRECWCGNNAPKPLTRAADYDCSFTCSGDAGEICGAGGRINVWGSPLPSPSTVGEFAYQGCYTDRHDVHSLTGIISRGDSMTLEKCAQACSAYQWFGVEFGTQCFCGTSMTGAGQKRPESECEARCGGNNQQPCGDVARLSVYWTGRDATGSNLPEVGDAPFRYKSCWTDSTAARTLTAAEYRSDDMTIESCAAFCKGFKLFGLEHARECYCGDELAASSEATGEEQCSVLCMGNAAQWCGNADRLSVYAVDDVQPSSPSATQSFSVVHSSSAVPSLSSAVVSSDVSSSSASTLASSSVETPPSSSIEITTTSTIASSASSTTPLTSSEAPTAAPTSTIASSPIVTSTSTPPPPTTSTTSTSTTACDLTVSYAAVPETCWVGLPTACASLNRTPTQRWPIVTTAATACRAGFIAAGTTAPAIAACFANVGNNQFVGTDAYSCVLGANVYCQSSTVCVGAAATGSPTIPTNALSNGNFDTGSLGPWALSSTLGTDSVISVGVVSGVSYNGGYSLRAVYDNSNGGSRTFTQQIALIPGTSYEASWWFYSTNAQSSTVTRMQFTGGTVSFVKDVATLNMAVGQWHKVTQPFVAATSFATVRVSMFGNKANAPNTFYMDDVKIAPVL